MTLLGDRLLAVHEALDTAGFTHAFGGAIALAYCVREPRGTRDIDVNIFVGVDRANEVLDALPRQVKVTKADRARALRDEQVRLWWDITPIDVFFQAHEFHRELAKEVRDVPFEGALIPVLGCEALVVFKAMFNRGRDWGDIEEVMAANTIDCRRTLDRLRALLGASDPAVVRLSAMCD